jgi:hypothetical protein
MVWLMAWSSSAGETPALGGVAAGAFVGALRAEVATMTMIKLNTTVAFRNPEVA